MTERDDRFQNQRRLVQLWRLRHLLYVPMCALLIRVRGRCEHPDGTVTRIPWGESWDIAVGWADVRMNWVYTMNEMRDVLPVED